MTRTNNSSPHHEETADLPRADIARLRELAVRVAEIAALPRQQETIRLWESLNALKPVRPMVMIDQIPWHEMNVDGELDLRCESEDARRAEQTLRRILYRWVHMPVDFVVEARWEVPRVVTGLDFGIRIDEQRAVQDPQNHVVGHFYRDQLATDDDLEAIRSPTPRLDVERTRAEVEKWRAVFDGILEVVEVYEPPMLSVWDRLVQWRGAEPILIDLAERPDFIHRIMRRMTDAYQALFDGLESGGILTGPQRWVHCTGAFRAGPPAPGFDPRAARLSDLWVAGMAQIFSSVSPDMHREFDLDYLIPLYRRFGHVYYGCCEPLDRKLDIVRTIPNLRKISMSPWVDVARGAEAIGRDYVFSRKPSPTPLGMEKWDPAVAESDLRATLDACRRHGCPLELILKDISSVQYEPRRLWDWAVRAHHLAKASA